MLWLYLLQTPTVGGTMVQVKEEITDQEYETTKPASDVSYMHQVKTEPLEPENLHGSTSVTLAQPDEKLHEIQANETGMWPHKLKC